MRCKVCGAELPEGAGFCTSCGAKVPQASASDDAGSRPVQPLKAVASSLSAKKAPRRRGLGASLVEFRRTTLRAVPTFVLVIIAFIVATFTAYALYRVAVDIIIPAIVQTQEGSEQRGQRNGNGNRGSEGTTPSEGTQPSPGEDQNQSADSPSSDANQAAGTAGRTTGRASRSPRGQSQGESAQNDVSSGSSEQPGGQGGSTTGGQPQETPAAAAYDDVLNQYRGVLSDTTYDPWTNPDAVMDSSKYGQVNEAIFDQGVFSKKPSNSDFAYAYVDLDGDGTNELVIKSLLTSVSLDTGVRQEIVAGYDFDGSKASAFLKSGLYKQWYTLTNSNQLLEATTGGAFDNYYTVYSFQNGSLVEQESLEAHDDKYRETRTYILKNKGQTTKTWTVDFEAGGKLPASDTAIADFLNKYPDNTTVNWQVL